LELLFSKYYGVEGITSRKLIPEDSLSYEKSAEIKELKLAFGDAFCEKVENYLWTVQLELNYLNDLEQLSSYYSLNEITTCDNNNAKQCNFSQEIPSLFYMLEIRFPEGMIKFINYIYLIIA